MAFGFIKPLEPTLVDEPPAGDGWFHEIKQDGYRTQFVIEDGNARAFSKRGLDWTRQYAPLVEAAEALPVRSAIIDGEVIVQDEQGRSNFSTLRSTIYRQPERLVFVAFDLMHLDGTDLCKSPIEQRRERLETVIGTGAAQRFLFSEAFDGEGSRLFAAARQHGLEGIVSKRRGSAHRSGPSRDWLKSKVFAEGEFEVVGVEPTTTKAPSALLAARDSAGRLQYVGQAMVTLSAENRETFWAYVEQNAAPSSPLGIRRKGVTWLRPGLVASAKYLAGEEMLRHATLTGMRLVKDREHAAG